MDKKEIFSKENKSGQIIRIICFLMVSIIFACLEKFNYLDLPGSYFTKHDSILLFVILLLIDVFLFTIYLINIFKIKNKKLYVILESVCTGFTYFFGGASLINLIVTQPKITFNPNYLSLFVTSSFTLLGFGLTSVSISIPFLVKILKKQSNEERADKILSLLVPYLFTFLFGLLFTILCLLELHNRDTSFYGVIAFKALFYSAAQILAIIVSFYSYLVTFVFKENNLLSK